jgi:hypothetical protein
LHFIWHTVRLSQLSQNLRNLNLSIFAVAEAILSLGYVPASRIEMHTVVEEECTGNGALVVAQEAQGQACIIPEPFDFIVNAQLGVAWFRGALEMHLFRSTIAKSSRQSQFVENLFMFWIHLLDQMPSNQLLTCVSPNLMIISYLPGISR